MKEQGVSKDFNPSIASTWATHNTTGKAYSTCATYEVYNVYN